MHELIKNQVEKLIIPSLQSADVVVVIVIDALGESKDKEILSEIPPALHHTVKRVPKVKFFITNRLKPQLKCCFHHLTCTTTTLSLHDIVLDLIENNIQVFSE